MCVRRDTVQTESESKEMVLNYAREVSSATDIMRTYTLLSPNNVFMKKSGGVEALRNDSGVSVTSTKGKLKVLQSHYQRLGSCSVDDAFDGNWKQEVDSEVNECHRCSVEHDDPVLDREIELQEIARCVRKLKNNKTGGSDGLVGELLKYGGSGMIHLLFEVVWSEELYSTTEMV